MVKVFLFCITAYVPIQIFTVLECLLCRMFASESILDTILHMMDDRDTSTFGRMLKSGVLIGFVPAIFICEKIGLLKDSEGHTDEDRG